MVMLTVRVPSVMRDALLAVASRNGSRPSDVHRRMLADGIRRATGGALWTTPTGEPPTADPAPRAQGQEHREA